MSLPNFMCIGAAKSGTTTLYDILSQHPDIFTPSFKEPHFFDIPINYKKGIDWYKKEYFNSTKHPLIGEFTPSYFFEKKSPERIFNNLGKEMKFIVILRHPVDRAYSHYLHSVRDAHEELSFLEALNNEDNRTKRFLDDGNYLAYLRTSYYQQSLYGEMIERYLQYFSINNFCFIHFEKEFVLKREETIKKVLKFLNVTYDSININIHLKSNTASKPISNRLKRIMKASGWWRVLLKIIIPSLKQRQIIKNRIQRINITKFTPDVLQEDLKKEIFCKYFAKDTQKIEDILKREMSWE